jgi:hypothetical protein
MSEYIYGDVDGELIFIKSDAAEQLALLHSGFATWGDAKNSLSAESWTDVVERFADGETDLPAGGEVYDLDAVPGHADGDWPAWPAREMLRDVPQTVREQYGKVEDTIHSGEYLHFDVSDEGEIVQALQAHGWTCVRDDALVRKASGH